MAFLKFQIGSYLGFALTWQCLLPKHTDEKNSKKIRALDSLIGMIKKFPYEDPTYEKLQEDLEKIRGKFKQFMPGQSELSRCSQGLIGWAAFGFQEFIGSAVYSLGPRSGHCRVQMLHVCLIPETLRAPCPSADSSLFH
ncbi:hypothetical protein ASZ78_004304 [Callipepla squamata]|uniref:Uncharacterized protein n=1 Tax=Callipepla squamata TaxID=9009 RepID=A0A226MDQ6_CALSU|nr:hypothetical protein ASZ78_004304 [Callipepla squamata]